MEAAATAPEEKWAYLDVWGLVRRRKGRIALGVFVGAALAVAACAVVGPWYESNARLLVVRKPLNTTPLSMPPQGQMLEDYLSTHILIITSPKVVGRAIETGNLAGLTTLRGRGEPTREILDSLLVTRDPPKPGVVPSNEILNLSFRGRSGEDCGKILDAIIASYQEFLKETYRSRSAQTLELIRRAKDEVQKDLDTTEAAYQEFRQQNPLLIKGKDGKSLQEDRLMGIDARRAALRLRRAGIEAALAAVDKLRRAGGTVAEMLEVLEGVRSNREAPVPDFLQRAEPWAAGKSQRATLEEELLNLQLYEGKLLEEYGKDYSEVRATRARIEKLRALLVPAAGGPGKPPREGAREQDLVGVKLELLRQDLKETKRAEKVLEGLFAREQEEAKAALVLELKDESYRQGIERRKLLYDSIIKRLQELDTVRDYGSYDTHVLTAPERGRWVLKKVLLVFGLGLMGGLLAGLAWAFLAEVSDKSFRGPADVGSRLHVPVLGHIPAAAAWGPPGPLLAACCRPDSREADAYREVRTALYARARAGGGKIIQVTSPDLGDGKTTLATNLAVSIAQSGRKVLLIDADFRSPRPDRADGVSNGVGLAALLRGKAAAAEVVQPSAVEGLSVLPSGPAPQNPAELLASPRLRAFFAEVAAAYDFVLVDTPSLLAVTDPMVVAAEADEVLLTVRLARNGRPRAERAKEILEAAGAKVLGVVINGPEGGPRSGRTDRKKR